MIKFLFCRVLIFNAKVAKNTKFVFGHARAGGHLEKAISLTPAFAGVTRNKNAG